MGTTDEERFLADPIGWRAALETVHHSWVRKGWDRAPFRKAVAEALARSVSKTGGFGLMREWLPVLERGLRVPDQVWLHQYLRDNANRPESEWRGSLLSAFPKLKGKLPPMDPEDDAGDPAQLLASLHWGIEHGDKGHIEVLIWDLLDASVDPLGPGPSGMSALERAEALGQPGLANLIREIIREAHEADE
jgi:hypothetical protein